MKFMLNLFFVAILLMGYVHCAEDEVDNIDDAENEVLDGQGKIFNQYKKLKIIAPRDTMDNVPLNVDDMVNAAKRPAFPVLSDSQRDPEVQEKKLKDHLDALERQYDEQSMNNDRRINPEETLDANAKATRSRNSKFLGFPNEEKNN